ncbi:MAG: glycosyl hydrolase family 28-related protein [Bacteroidota bacterium]
MMHTTIRIFIKYSTVFFILMLLSFKATSQIIPEDRTYAWSFAGSYALFEDPGNAVNVSDFGAEGDGITNDAEAIQQAIDSFDGEPGIVHFAEGNYLIESPLSLNSGIVMRGIDSLSTRILIDFGGDPIHALRISGQAGSDFISLNSGYQKGSDELTADHDGAFSAGDYAEIVQDNGDWDTEPASWAENSVGQIVKITNVEGETLTLEHPLRIDYSGELQPRIRLVEPKTNVAIEKLKIERLDEPAEGAGSNIYINMAANIRMKDIESYKSVGSHIAAYRSTQVRLEGSYIHHAFTYDGSGTRGYGITLHMHSGECLIENNVFQKLRHAMMVKTGANGNVFGYNYSIEPYRSETIHDYTGDISLHGHYAYANLFEGNIVQNIFIDHYWGPSGLHNTFFRNRAELYGFVITESDNPTNQQNIVGLEVTNENFLYGLYTLNGDDHFEYGNFVTGDVLPEETDSLPDNSYYLDTVPDFWAGSMPWPSIGIPLAANEYDIPAKHRYLGINTNQQNIIKNTIKLAPNPARDYFYIHGTATKQVDIKIYNSSGIPVYSGSVKPNHPVKVSHFPEGVYIVRIQNRSETTTAKLLIRH